MQFHFQKYIKNEFDNILGDFSPHTNLSSAETILKSQIDGLLSDVGVLKIDEYDKFANELRDALLLTWNKQEQEVISEIITTLPDTGQFTAADLEIAQSKLGSALGPQFVSKVGEPLYEFHLSSYSLGQEQVLSGVTPTFNLVDEKALRILNKHNVYWVGENYGNNLYGKVQKIGNKILTEGLSRVDAGALFQNELEQQLRRYGKYYWEGFANHVVTRSREMGRVEGYVKADAESYRIVAVLDEYTSPICQEMHGRVFEVQRAVELRDKIINADNPEDVKKIAPWRKPDDIIAEVDQDVSEMKEIDTADLPAGLELPPYHFRCRTRTVKES